MIVRIATEGQYELADGSRQEFEQLETQALDACEAVDESSFKASFGELIAFVRSNGEPVGEDRLVGSDLILPAAGRLAPGGASRVQRRGSDPGLSRRRIGRGYLLLPMPCGAELAPRLGCWMDGEADDGADGFEGADGDGEGDAGAGLEEGAGAGDEVAGAGELV